MFSYRHAFHAGNHADVFKHLCQMLLLQKLRQKDKPFVYIDSHSGAGCYRTDSDMATKNKEYLGGIDALLKRQDLPPSLTDYCRLVKTYRAHQQYPGSPAIAKELMRPQDNAILMEWHNNEFKNLYDYLGRKSHIACHHRDGYEGLKALTPPKPARGMVLIDPPYELSDDYQQVVETISQVHQRWPTGIIALWYPLLASTKDKSHLILDGLLASQPTSLYMAEMWVKPQPEEVGMYGSGMVFVNLPWQLDSQIEQCLPLLADTLSENGAGGYRSNWLIQAA